MHRFGHVLPNEALYLLSKWPYIKHHKMNDGVTIFILMTTPCMLCRNRSEK